MTIREKKEDLKKSICKNHPRRKDMHKYISDRDGEYRDSFMKIYDEKCCYCGVSLDIIPNRNFQIDHFIHEKSKLFEQGNRLSKTHPGDIRNIVLACSNCNSKKSDFQFSNDRMHLYPFHPDKNIDKIFIRSNVDYSICIAKDYEHKKEIKAFYDKLDLGNYIHQLDFLIIRLKKLKKSCSDKNIKTYMGDFIEELLQKRNRIDL